MKRFLSLFVASLFCCALLFAEEAKQEETKKTDPALEAAKKTYEIEVAKAEEKLRKAFDEAIKKVTQKGDLEGANALAAEKKDYLGDEDKSKASSSKPMTKKQKEIIRLFCGTWRYNNGVVHTYSPDGSAVNGTLRGKWTIKENAVVAEWEHGYIDTFRFPLDGKTLNLVNNKGDRYQAVRVE